MARPVRVVVDQGSDDATVAVHVRDEHEIPGRRRERRREGDAGPFGDHASRRQLARDHAHRAVSAAAGGLEDRVPARRWRRLGRCARARPGEGARRRARRVRQCRGGRARLRCRFQGLCRRLHARGGRREDQGAPENDARRTGVTMAEAYIVGAARSPIGKKNGRLSKTHPTDLLGAVLRALLERADLDPLVVDDVVGGCVTQCGAQGSNVTRNAWIAAGLPWDVPATSVDRQCGSSQQAAHFVAQGVMAGAYEVAVACGVESMTRVPLASNAKGGMGPFSRAFMGVIDDQLKTQFEVAQILADQWKISREDMDAFALESHRRASRATEGAQVARELVAVPVKDGEGRPTGTVLEADEGIRSDTSMEKLAALPS